MSQTFEGGESSQPQQRTEVPSTFRAAPPTGEYSSYYGYAPPPTRKNSIFRAPAHIRYSRQSDFEPRLVSIGPYYHKKENLQTMEDLKLRCALDLIKKGQNSERILSNLLDDALGDLETEAREFYKEKSDLTKSEFIQMLGIDACFIIRVVLSFSQTVQESMAFLDVNIKDVRSDMLLLENQIPLFFIQKLYDYILKYMEPPKFPSFLVVLEPFIFLDMPWKFNHEGMSRPAAHLLDLYWQCSLQPNLFEIIKNHPPRHSEQEQPNLFEIKHHSRRHSKQEQPNLFEIKHHSRRHSKQEQPSLAEIHLSTRNKSMVPNATELHRMAGITFEELKDDSEGGRGVIRFKRNDFKESITFEDLLDDSEGGRGVIRFKRNDFKEIIFSKGICGIMQMPCLKIDFIQTRLLVNLIAFENSMLEPHSKLFSCYMKFMDALIDSEKDVEFLQQCGVIYNTLSSHKMAATFFNDVGNFCTIDSRMPQISEFYEEVLTHYESSSNRAWASLRHQYLNNRWAIVSVTAGSALLILTVLQTFYTIYAYYHPRSG